ncbi:erythromycin esterase family protein [Promicromonospora sp. NPDC023987]|uniref:erythromycin esterase family protein n=1 Tax=Promicromonospora sp. NPDC023987 TaxID=3155360 RepID=UPI0033FABB4B
MLAVAGSLAMALAGCGTARDVSRQDVVLQWVRETTTPVATVGPNDTETPLTDTAGLAAVDELVADATVVGLGESAHGLGDQFVVRQRLARYLVEEHGYRTIAFEEDYGSGVAIDRYITEGVGNPRELVGSMVAAWRSEQMLGFVEWMRDFNQGHPEDPVRFLGTDVTQLRQLSFDELTRYASAVAPGRVDELAAHLDAIALRGSPGEQIGWLFEHPDQEGLVEHARAVRDLVAELPQPRTEAETAERADMERHAAAVLGFYLNYTGRDPDFRDRVMADTLRGWQEQTRSPAIYWAANVHVAAASRVDYNFPPTEMGAQLVPAGHHLRETYGEHYVPIAAVFGSARVLQGWETGQPAVYDVPAPGEDTLDHILHRAGTEAFLLDLTTSAPPPVTDWLHEPARMRLIGAAYDEAQDADYSMRLDSLVDGFDAVVYLSRTGEAELLSDE